MTASHRDRRSRSKRTYTVSPEVVHAAVIAREAGVSQYAIYQTMRRDLYNYPSEHELRRIWADNGVRTRRGVRRAQRARKRSGRRPLQYEQNLIDRKELFPSSVPTYTEHYVESIMLNADIDAAAYRNTQMRSWLGSYYVQEGLWY